MNLEGSLEIFSAADIVQLVASTRKSGALHVAGATQGTLWFEGGELTGAVADRSRQVLARAVLGAVDVPDDAVEAAVRRATDRGDGGDAAVGPVGVVRALLDAATVDVDAVRAAVTDAAVENAADLLAQTEGDFAFVPGEDNPDDVGVRLPVERLTEAVAEHRRRWAEATAEVPDPAAVPVRARPDGEVRLDPVEWDLVGAADGARTVAEVVEDAGHGRLTGTAALARLVRRGLVRLLPAGSAPTLPSHVAAARRREELLAPLERAYAPVQGPDLRSAAPAAVPLVLVEPAPTYEAPETPALPAAGDVPDAAVGAAPLLGGPHVPRDVVPPRPEPFLPRREADFDDGSAPAVGAPAGSPAVAGERRATQSQAADAGPGGASAADPPVTAGTAVAGEPPAGDDDGSAALGRTTMLRLIAGVRGL